jgi:hypothetical protein
VHCMEVFVSILSFCLVAGIHGQPLQYPAMSGPGCALALIYWQAGLPTRAPVTHTLKCTRAQGCVQLLICYYRMTVDMTVDGRRSVATETLRCSNHPAPEFCVSSEKTKQQKFIASRLYTHRPVSKGTQHNWSCMLKHCEKCSTVAMQCTGANRCTEFSQPSAIIFHSSQLRAL